jgi:hypothetical protein
MILQQREQLLFLLQLGFLGYGTDEERDLEQFRPAGAGIVIGNDNGDVDGQLVAFVPLKEIC